MKYGRGSILVYKDEVVLMLYPEDNTTYFEYVRTRSIGPKRKFEGLLPDSTFYTKGGVHVRVLEAFQSVSNARQTAREREEFYLEHPEYVDIDDMSKDIGVTNMHRCSEAFGLAGAMHAKRKMRQFAAHKHPLSAADRDATYLGGGTW